MELIIKTPAQLWIGSSLDLVDAAEQYLQTVFCPYKGCRTCTQCMSIRQRQHHNLMWLNPSGNYTLELLKPFFSTISCALMHDEQFYFIFQNADYLSHACSNSLLKSIEEPPQGYNFIFLAQQEHAIVTTLRSRCALRLLEKKSYVSEDESLVTCFTTRLADVDLFLQSFEKALVDEHTTLVLLEKIINFWSLAYIKNYDEATSHIILARIDSCNKALQNPPMPGGAKIFWKNLFLQFLD